MFQAKVVEKIKKHVRSITFFFRKSCRLRNNVEKFGRGRQATDVNKVHALCMVDYQGYC
jgi:hypothetical protein